MELDDLTLMESWAENEFAAADLGDVRRTRRLIAFAERLGNRPTASLPDATNDPAMLKAAYRFFDTDAIDPAAILASHVQATYDRMASVPLVLAVQDTTSLDWTHHPATRDLGPLASTHQQGLLAHTTLALTPERVPLGLLAQQVWARDAASFAQLPDHKTRPISEKESYKWLLGVEAASAARRACPDTQIVVVCDAEADLFDLFVQPRAAGVDLLIRASQNRRVEHPNRFLWEAMATGTLAGTRLLDIPKRDGQPARQATVTVRFARLTLRAPKHRAKEGLAAVRVWAVWAVEEQPPAGLEPVEWLLLTTVAVETAAAAEERLEWYACRWGIEVWHKVLKSGCRIEAVQLECADRLKRCLAVYSVISWRIVWATMLARALPDAPCTALLEEEEWQALYCTIHRTGLVPAQAPSLRQAVRWIAQLGGFQGRTGDGEPGVTVLWKGFQHLADLTMMYHILRADAPGKRAHPPSYRY